MADNIKSEVEGIRSTLEKMGGQFKAVLPTQAHVDRFIRVVMTAVQSNIRLLEADRTSFYASCMRCAQDGLMPDAREAVLKIYNTRVPGTKEWQSVVAYEPMVEGLLKKLRLSGEVVGAPKVHVVYAADLIPPYEFTYELGDNERIVHKPAIFSRGEIVAAYSIVKLRSGGTSREVMSIEDIDRIMQRSKSKKEDGTIYGPWVTDKPEMCRKTVFKRHYKRLPRSSDLDNVINYDDEANGIELERHQEGTREAQAAAAQGSSAQAPARRPAALEAVARAGGIPMPTQPIPARQRESVTLDQPPDPERDRAYQENAGPPEDII